MYLENIPVFKREPNLGAREEGVAGGVVAEQGAHVRLWEGGGVFYSILYLSGVYLRYSPWHSFF